MKKSNILDTPCYLVDSVDEAKKFIEKLVDEGTGGYSTAINAEKILMYSEDAEMKSVIDNSVLPVPDGSGAVLAFKFLEGARSLRLDLPNAVLDTAHKKKYSMFFLGATEESNKEAVDVIKKKFPNIEIVGRRNGFFQNENEIIEMLKVSKPQIVFVALGSPKQEKFAARVNEILPKMLFIGCGGALDILAGKVKRAPKFYQDNHLEWFYRLIKEPKRIKRQKRLPLFFFRLVKETVNQRIKK